MGRAARPVRLRQRARRPSRSRPRRCAISWARPRRQDDQGLHSGLAGAPPRAEWRCDRRCRSRPSSSRGDGRPGAAGQGRAGGRRSQPVAAMRSGGLRLLRTLQQAEDEGSLRRPRRRTGIGCCCPAGLRRRSVVALVVGPLAVLPRAAVFLLDLLFAMCPSWVGHGASQRRHWHDPAVGQWPAGWRAPVRHEDRETRIAML